MKSSTLLKKVIAVALLSACGVAQAFADREKAGNGGNAAVCFKSAADVVLVKKNDNRIGNDQLSNIEFITALDLYQAESAFKGKDPAKHLVLPQLGEDEMAYVSRIAKRFEKAIPRLQEILTQTAALFNSKKNTYYTEGGIDRIHDTAETFYLDPLKCVIATVIRRTSVGSNVELEYDWRLFNHPRHRKASRGVLTLHEVVYQWGQIEGHKDSFNTRRLIANALIRRNITRDEVFEELANNRFGTNGDGYSIAKVWDQTLEGKHLQEKVAAVINGNEVKATSVTFRSELQKLGQPNFLAGNVSYLRKALMGLTSGRPYWNGLHHPHKERLKTLSQQIPMLEDKVKNLEKLIHVRNRQDRRRFQDEYAKDTAQLASLKAEQAKRAGEMESDLVAVTPKLISLVTAEYARITAGMEARLLQMAADALANPDFATVGAQEIANHATCISTRYRTVPVVNACDFSWQALGTSFEKDVAIPVIE